MAKKGGQQQLQVDIQTNEDLYTFIERPGLLVIDVYSEWCGPCVAMVGSLRKIKLEKGGDDLFLAICKSDTVEVFERYRNKSEPVWLFATKQKLVNIMFGADVPKLMALIVTELELLRETKKQRIYYELWELQPEEKARRDVIENAKAEALRIEIEEAQRQRQQYLDYCTDAIMTNLSEFGVTIFGPQVPRDLYKKLAETGERNRMQVKERRNLQLQPEDFEVINYACENPIDPEVLEQLWGKDVMICYWKVTVQGKERLEDLVREYARDVTTPKKVYSEFGDLMETIEPLITPLQIKITTTVEEPEKEDVVEEEEPEPEPVDDIMAGLFVPDMDQPDEDGAEEAEGEEEEEAPIVEEVLSATSSEGQIITIPPIWVPHDRRTHATLIYVFFRHQTASFLPPDPVPDPPHVVMAFDAFKKKDVFEVAAKHEENVLFYGFFTDDDPDKAKLIANTLAGYESQVQSISDKLVLKVAKQTSHTVLAFVSCGPTFVSRDTVLGKEHALRFFPKDYTNNPVTETDDQ